MAVQSVHRTRPDSMATTASLQRQSAQRVSPRTLEYSFHLDQQWEICAGIHLEMTSETTRSYSAALSPVRVDSCKNPMTTLIQSRKSRNHRQGVDQSSSITQVVRDNSAGLNVWCSSGVNSFDGLGNNDIVSRASMSLYQDSLPPGECRGGGKNAPSFSSSIMSMYV